MPPRLTSGRYGLDFEDLYAHLWKLSVDDGVGGRIYSSSGRASLSSLVKDLSGAPASAYQASRENNELRHQVRQVLSDGNWAVEITERRFRLLRAPAQSHFEWPTIEWVKEPVNLASGHPSGGAIRMRHLADCAHWYRNEDGSLAGGPAELATDDQLAEVPPCGTCIGRAKSSGHEDWGPRLASDYVDSPGLSHLRKEYATDARSLQNVRREQPYLRRHLLQGHTEWVCAICGRRLPASMLIAAHIAPRRLLDEAERLDFRSAAMLACLLGCDSLFEEGYIVVDKGGKVVAGKVAESSDLELAVQDLVGLESTAFTSATAPRFEAHRLHHGTY